MRKICEVEMHCICCPALCSIYSYHDGCVRVLVFLDLYIPLSVVDALDCRIGKRIEVWFSRSHRSIQYMASFQIQLVEC